MELRRTILLFLPRSKKSVQGAILEKGWEDNTINLCDLLLPEERKTFFVKFLKIFQKKKVFKKSTNRGKFFLLEVFELI